ncbi:MAG: hypothetical protein HRU09_02395 [Oligoflexales bacterium]|nr:hypothetical protein [Oligoflexales bacterium]
MNKPQFGSKNKSNQIMDDDFYITKASKKIVLSGNDVHRAFLYAKQSQTHDDEFNEYLEAMGEHAKKFNLER